jgi:predicted dinucleotide-binding enzyme
MLPAIEREETGMRIGVLGTGMVGVAIATRLVELGHDVTMGSRSADNEASNAWADAHGDHAHAGTFADAASFGELVFNCTKGSVALDVLELAGAESLAGKVLVDVSNPLDFSTGQLQLTVVNDDSMGEQIQRALPETHVVKTLNTMNCNVMVHPDRIDGEHVVFVCGNDDDAKQTVRALLGEFGWPEQRMLDLGDLTAARAVEMYLPLWLRMYQATGTVDFNLVLAGAGVPA